MNTPVLTIQNLRLAFSESNNANNRLLLDDVSLTINSGQCVALVGESGSGKSLTALACARLLPDAVHIVGGNIILGNNPQKNTTSAINIFDLSRAEMPNIRGKRIGFIFQEPSLALNPVLTVGEQLIEALALHGKHKNNSYNAHDLKQAAITALTEVGIVNANERLNDYPLQFSGGQKQRIMIAIALAGSPDVLIADEPTTALDVLVQAQVLQLLRTLQRQRGMALLLITHDLSVVRQMADSIAVMQAGKIVEYAPVAVFFAQPTHPHSQALLAANRITVLCAASNSKPLDDISIKNSIHSNSSAVVNSLSSVINKPLPLLTVKSVNAAYINHSHTALWSLWHQPSPTSILRDIDLQLAHGETLALIGASGSGKTTLAKVLLGLQDRNLQCQGILKLGELSKPAAIKPTRVWQQNISVVFQDPYASLNPRIRVGDSIKEGIHQLRPEWSPIKANDTIAALMHAVDLPINSLNRWPHEFSGGQRQRLAIVRALAIAPKLVILDEPTSALDATVQAKLLQLLVDLQRQFGSSYVLITHNFQVVQAMAHHVAVLHQGQVVEYGLTDTVLQKPQHVQTQNLLNAIINV